MRRLLGAVLLLLVSAGCGEPVPCDALETQEACERAGASCMALVLNLARGTAPDGTSCYQGR